jgi:hypothetical protein
MYAPTGRLGPLHVLICMLALPWVRAADLGEQVRATLAADTRTLYRPRVAYTPTRIVGTYAPPADWRAEGDSMSLDKPG